MAPTHKVIANVYAASPAEAARALRALADKIESQPTLVETPGNGTAIDATGVGYFEVKKILAVYTPRH